MKKYIIFLSLCLTQKSQAQLNPYFNIVSDPDLSAQKIIEGVAEYILYREQESGEEETNNKMAEISDQDRSWYNSLKQIKNSIAHYEKIYSIIQTIDDTRILIIQNLDRIRRDPNFSAQEIIQIASGYTKIITEGVRIIDDLNTISQETDLSVTDKKRIDIIDKIYDRVGAYKALVQYYTKKNISISYLRAKKKNNQNRVQELYGR
jgi:hypothetical protein